MDVQIVSDIIYEHKLDCTVDEFVNMINSVDESIFKVPAMQYKICNFNEKYDTKHTIINPTTVASAVYYILKYDDVTMLQTHHPYESGMKPMYSTNVLNIITMEYERIKAYHIKDMKILYCIEHIPKVTNTMCSTKLALATPLVVAEKSKDK